MNVKYQHLQAFGVSCLLLTIMASKGPLDVVKNIIAQIMPQPQARMDRASALQEGLSLTPLERQAKRLQARMESRFGSKTTQLAAVRALNNRQRLMLKALTVTFSPDTINAPEVKNLRPWFLSTQSHAEWMIFNPNPVQPDFFLSLEAIAKTLDMSAPEELYPVEHVGVRSPVDDNGVLRVQSNTFAHAGFSLNPFDAARTIANALQSGVPGTSVPVHYEKPLAYIMASDGTVRELSLLSTGRSDFEGSPSGREKNIQKALQEEVTDILVPPGETFSFNDTIIPSLNRGGWHMALAIFEGGRLDYVPGGGICQAATTIYRAALLAGLPILKQRNHSLYVTYYAKYGTGLDATVYPGEQDLVFQNDTTDYILIQSTVEGTEAVVHFYGVPDGRTVAISGPYFDENAPEGVKAKSGKDLGRNEIAWMRTITKRDGTASNEILVSRYKALPKTMIRTDEAHLLAYTNKE